MFTRSYRFNEKTCSYEQAAFSREKIFSRVLFFLTISSLSSFLALFIYPKYFESPVEKTLKEENETLKGQYRIIESQIDEIVATLDELKTQDEMLYKSIFGLQVVKSGLESSVASTFDDLVLPNTLKKLTDVKTMLSYQTDSYQKLFKLTKDKERYLASVPAIQPISNKTLKRISSGFGERLHPIHKVWCMHGGIDYVAAKGTPVYATGGGYVRKATFFGGYGNCVEIDHGFGIITRYAHLSKFRAFVGQRVLRGDCIGYVGDTGTALGNHLHYEVLKSEKRMNPVHYLFGELNAAQYDKVVEVASRSSRNIA